MGLFGKKDTCPICGSEVKGLFNKKIADKKTLCKDCSNQVSMSKELLKTATPEYMKEHLQYRQKNALKYNALRWDEKYDVRGTKMGVDRSAGFLYITDADMDDIDNPVVFSFKQIKSYELYRLNKKVDDAEMDGPVALESALSAFVSVAKILDKDRNSQDFFRLVIDTTEPYWPHMEFKIHFDSPDDVHGVYGFGRDLQCMCQTLKDAVRQQ